MLLLRTSAVSEVKGGLTAVFGALLDQFFSPTGHDMRMAGVRLPMADSPPLHAFFCLGAVVADEGALHAMYACKGSSGLRPCLLCRNVFNRRSTRDIVACDLTSTARTHDCTELGELLWHSSGSLGAIVRRLQQAAASGGPRRTLEELQTRLGWTFEPEGVMFNSRWRDVADPSGIAMFDFMHVWFVGGIFNTQVGLALHALRGDGITPQTLHAYMALWRWPASVGSLVPTEVFCPKRAKSTMEAGILKATASECLSLWPVLAQFFQGLLDAGASPAVQPHAECFLRLAHVLGLLQSTARRPVEPEVLEKAVGDHLRAFRQLYGPEAMTPKFHYALHFGHFLRRLGWLPNAFVHERKHKMPKRFANQAGRCTSQNFKTGCRTYCCSNTSGFPIPSFAVLAIPGFALHAWLLLLRR